MTKTTPPKVETIVIPFPSDSHSERAKGSIVDKLVMHFTVGPLDHTLANRICNPEWPVSAHFVIAKTGEIFYTVGGKRNAWHAGEAYWRGTEFVNSTSIGIEIVNSGKEHFTPEQMDAVRKLASHLIKDYNIPPYNVIGHSDVAPTRKNDPGMFFPWKWLAENGIGLWPDNPKPVEWDGDVSHLQRRLKEYGYGVDITGEMNEQTSACIKAFQQHFREERGPEAICNGEWDADCEGRLTNLLTLMREQVVSRYTRLKTAPNKWQEESPSVHII